MFAAIGCGLIRENRDSPVQAFEADEFITAITRHIPEKSFQLVRYYGWYSNRTKR